MRKFKRLVLVPSSFSTSSVFKYTLQLIFIKINPFNLACPMVFLIYGFQTLQCSQKQWKDIIPRHFPMHTTDMHNRNLFTHEYLNR